MSFEYDNVRKAIAYITMALIFVGAVYLPTLLNIGTGGQWILIFSPILAVFVGMTIANVTMVGVLLTFLLISLLLPIAILVELSSSLGYASAMKNVLATVEWVSLLTPTVVALLTFAVITYAKKVYRRT